MKSESERERIRAFLLEPVPPGGTFEWEVWQAECRSFGKDALEVFLDAIKNGDECQQYAAVLGLRLHGYEAHADGFDVDTVYKVKPPQSSEWNTIVPSRPPRKLSSEDYAIGTKLPDAPDDSSEHGAPSDGSMSSEEEDHNS